MNDFDWFLYCLAWWSEFMGCILLDAVDDLVMTWNDVVVDGLDPYYINSPMWKVVSWINKRECEVCGDIKVVFGHIWNFLRVKLPGGRWKFLRAFFWVIAYFFDSQEDRLIADLEELGWRAKVEA